MAAKRRVLFFVYQRTVFADAYRTATRLRKKTEYDPAFLVAAGTFKLVQDECFSGDNLILPFPYVYAGEDSIRDESDVFL